ncbi:MAG: DUF6114 domain-containing protein [Haloarculaceae archaeon]
MSGRWSDVGTSLGAWLDDPRGKFREWRQPRPVGGGLLLLFSGFLIAYVPVHYTSQLMLVGGAYTVIGMLFAVLVGFCGLAALAKPELSSIFGVFGAALATLSIFGALGGLFVGTLLGTVGGVLCYAWEPPAGFEYDETTLAEASGFIWQEAGGFIWQNSQGFIWQTEDKGSDRAADGDDESGSDFEGGFEF